MKTPVLFLILFLLISACKGEKNPPDVKKNSELTDTIKSETSIEHTEDFSQYEAEDYEDDMKFMPPIENDSYFGIMTGSKISDHQTSLKPGELQSGEGVFDVYYIVHKVDTLGYVYGKSSVESIHIWDPRSATNDGIRVGTTFGELKTIVTELKVHGSELESRVHVFNEKHMYRLDYYSMEYNLDQSEIPDSTKVQEIIIVK